jgi:hypothetical protein
MFTQIVIALCMLVSNGTDDGIVPKQEFSTVAPNHATNAKPADSAEEAYRLAAKEFEEMEKSFNKQRIKERQDLEEKKQRLRWLRREHEAKLQSRFSEIQKTEVRIQEIKTTLVPGGQVEKATSVLHERKEKLQAEADERAKQIIAAIREIVVLEENLKFLERQQAFSRQRAREKLEVLQKRSKYVP